MTDIWSKDETSAVQLSDSVCSHGLHGRPISSGSVNGDWLNSQWEMEIFDPLQNRHPLTDRFSEPRAAHSRPASQIRTKVTPCVECRRHPISDRWD